MKMKVALKLSVLRWRSRFSGRSHAGSIVLCLCAFAAAATPARTQETAAIERDSASAFASFEAPGAGTGALQGTVAISINAGGRATGIYFDANGVTHGFVRAPDGAITPFDAPGAGTGKNQGTLAMSINAGGAIAGWCVDAKNVSHGFVRAEGGAITGFNVPGAGTDGHRGTIPLSINAAGTIAGSFSDGNAVFHGFLRAANGSFTKFDALGAGSNPYSDDGTVAFAVNATGTVTGYYNSSTSGAHGFVRAVNGAITSFDAPEALSGGGFLGTNPTSIDAAGEIAGTYIDSSSKRHGFLRDANGTIVPFDAPGADKAACTPKFAGTIFCGAGAVGINKLGDVTGVYVDTDGVLHGFLRAADSEVTAFEAPGAGRDPGGLAGTAGIGISDAGLIAGGYADANSVFHGFVFAPVLISTSVSLTASISKSVYGEPVTLTAKVTSSDGAPPNGEDVVFMNGKVVLGTKALSGGSATLTTTMLPVGTDSITAAYSGELNFAGHTSKAVSHIVGKAKSSTKLTSSANPSLFGDSVTFTATVSGQFGGAVKGTVTFSDGKTVLKAVALSGGVAKHTTTTLPKGTDSITAVFSGDAQFDASTSNTVKQVVAAK